MNAAAFGPREFQLVLLRRMADHQPGLVEDARHELSATLAEMRRGVSRRPGPDQAAASGPGGAVWNEWLVRARGAAAPVLVTVDDLVPWSCTVARAFAPARPIEGSAPTRWALGIGDGADGGYVAEFTWGLLQRVLPGG